MFNKNEEINNLQKRIKELEKQLIDVSNATGTCIIKQLPNGEMELNGQIFDNTTPVEYYNSSKATYGELTMYRIGVETKKREIENLIQNHLAECDNYKNQINKLNADIDWHLDEELKKSEMIITLQEEINRLNKLYENTMYTADNDIQILKDEIIELKNRYENMNKYLENDIKTWKDRYDYMINLLEKDIILWKERYLTLNNVNDNGTIITKYGELQGE